MTSTLSTSTLKRGAYTWRKVMFNESVPFARDGDCALCGHPYENWGNNPEPLLASSAYRVCDDCNQYVIFVRMGWLKMPWLSEVQ